MDKIPGITNFRRLAVLTTAMTYLLVFVGGLVRVAGAGLGCPDWPKCFGRWIPPLHAGQLPPEIDPATFNFTLAWIEYINRLTGVGVGLLIAWLAVLSLIRMRNYPRILWPAILAALLTAFQGWQGSVVVASELEPVVVSVHMLVALVIVSLLVYLTVQTYRLEHPEIAAARYPSNLRIAVFVLWIFVLIQVVLGTQVRESIEILIRQFPLLSDPELVARVGLVGWIHTLLGIFVAIACWLVGFMIVNRSAPTDPLATQGAWALTGLALIQVILGLVLFAVGIPRVVQVLHMWIASMIAGLVLMLLALTKPLKETV